jgi:hypothetical protein
MSKLLKYFAAVALVAGAMAFTPNVASAQRHHGGGGGGWHHGGGGGGWRHHGWRGGGWRGGGWGWGPGFALGFGAAYPYYYGGPYYAQAGDCGWVRTRVWRRGYWVIRRAWRCW